MVMIALFVGLRPKGGSSANDVRWLAEQRGLRFQGQGMAFVENVGSAMKTHRETPFSIEMAVTPSKGRLRGYNPLLVMHGGHDPNQMTIWQYSQSLIVMNGDDYDNRKRRARLVARDVFTTHKTRFVTVVSGPRGSRLYVDGKVAAAKRDMHLTLPYRESKLRLVLGNSVYANHGWRGDIHGIAITGIALDEAAVKRRHETWLADRSFDFIQADSQMLRFDSNAGAAGRLIKLPTNQSLHLPERLVALEKRFLELPWASLKWDRKAVLDIVINIVGFIPIGMVVYGFVNSLAGPSNRHGQAVAIMLCLILSLFIELTQAFIPSRISSLRDLLLNTFGAWAGVVGWRVIGSRLISERRK
jgi:VanZ family protein